MAAAAATNPDIHERFTRDVLTPVSHDIEAMVRDARERGHARPDAPADFIFDVILGTLIHRYIIRQLPPDPEFLERLTSLTWFLYQDVRGLRFCRIGSGRYGLWRSVRALEKRTGVGDRRAVLVSRLFLSPTPVHNSNRYRACGPRPVVHV